MSRFIDEEILIKKIFPYDIVDKRLYSINAKAIYEAIKEAPTADFVDVVRCKDCKHYQNDTFFGQGWCNGRRVEKDGFCSHGERRDHEKQAD